MNENDIYTILQRDGNLREAIRRREQKLPPMPASLNERLVERLEEEAFAKPSSHHRRIWPWIAAACVAAMMVVVTIWQTEQPFHTPQGRQETAHQFPSLQGKGIGVGSVIKTAQSKEKLPTPPLTAPLQGRGAATHNKDVALMQRMEINKGKVVRQGMETKKEVEVTQKMETPEGLIRDKAKAVLASSVKEEPELKPTVLTERDIPITRPENYRYTSEDLALMKEQAQKAYVKRVQLELEIAKQNLEQTANNYKGL